MIESDIGSDAIAACRAALAAPPKAAAWWDGLTRGEQRLLAVGGCLTAAIIGAPWSELCEADQRAIIDTARRASRWAAQLMEAL